MIDRHDVEPVVRMPEPGDSRDEDARLDEALMESFPASDPVSLVRRSFCS